MNPRKWRRHFSEQAEGFRVARLAEGITQVELARALGKPRAWLSQREGGHRPLRPKDSVAILAALLRLTKRKMDKNSQEMAPNPVPEMADLT